MSASVARNRGEGGVAEPGRAATMPAKAAIEARLPLRADSLFWLLGGTAFLITSVLLFAASYSLESDRSQAIESALRDNESLVRAFEEHIVHTLMHADQLAWSLKQQVERRGLPDDLRTFVEKRTLPGTPFHMTVVTDEHGEVVRQSLPGRAGSVADTAHFQAAAREDSGRLVVGQPMIGRLSGKPTLPLARRINKPDGSFGGIATVALDHGYFARVYGQFKLGRGGFIMLAGTDGLVRVNLGASGADAVGQRIGSPELLQRIALQAVGSYKASEAPGTPPQIVSYRVLGQYPLVVVIGRSVDDALAQIRDHESAYAAGTLLLCALVWASFGMLGWQMVRQRREGLQLQEANLRTEAANRVKSDFVANMTHELRTPLDRIIGDTVRLQEALRDESQRECARIIHSSALSLLGMVDSVLDMARIDAGSMTVELRQEALRPLLDELAAVHGACAERKGLTFALGVAPDLPAEVACDRGRLRQVMDNLLGNAVKFTEQGRVGLSARVDHDRLLLAVRDTGPGIPAAMHEAVFERFGQGERAGVGLRTGTGLGLALARDLVRLMGGQLELDSQPGSGSEFRVVLPLRRAAPLAALAASAAGS